LNNDGEVECDAMIMDGHTMETGIWFGRKQTMLSNEILVIELTRYHYFLSKFLVLVLTYVNY
jgi:hypothetical protein